MIDSIVDFLNNSQGAILLTTIGGFVVSVTLEKIKKWLSLQSDKVITFLLTAFSFLAVAIESLLSSNPESLSAIGLNSTVIFFAANIAYRYVVKPGKGLIEDARAFRTETVENVTQDVPEAAQNVAVVDGVAPVSESEFPTE